MLLIKEREIFVGGGLEGSSLEARFMVASVLSVVSNVCKH